MASETRNAARALLPFIPRASSRAPLGSGRCRRRSRRRTAASGDEKYDGHSGLCVSQRISTTPGLSPALSRGSSASGRASSSPWRPPSSIRLVGPGTWTMRPPHRSATRGMKSVFGARPCASRRSGTRRTTRPRWSGQRGVDPDSSSKAWTQLGSPPSSKHDTMRAQSRRDELQTITVAARSSRRATVQLGGSGSGTSPRSILRTVAVAGSSSGAESLFAEGGLSGHPPASVRSARANVPGSIVLRRRWTSVRDQPCSSRKTCATASTSCIRKSEKRRPVSFTPGAKARIASAAPHGAKRSAQRPGAVKARNAPAERRARSPRRARRSARRAPTPRPA